VLGRKRGKGLSLSLKKLQGLLDVDEMSEATGWKKSTIRQKVWLRQIEFVRMGRCIRFKPETVERLILEGTVLPLKKE
jgi:excisionase family DNA binding protein